MNHNRCIGDYEENRWKLAIAFGNAIAFAFAGEAEKLIRRQISSYLGFRQNNVFLSEASGSEAISNRFFIVGKS